MNYVKDLIELNLNLSFRNSLIIGDNTSGKTYLLEQLFKKTKDSSYYISVNNRNINLSYLHLNNHNPLRMSKTRALNKLYDLRVGNATDAIQDLWLERELAVNFFAETFSVDDNKGVIEDFFQSKISIKPRKVQFGTGSNVITLNDIDHLTLSNGLSSIFRILLELQLASKMGCSTVFIDEIEKYLDSSNSFKLIQFIQKKYSNMRLIITTHSEDIIVGSSDFNIVKINNDSPEVNLKSIDIYDSNEFESIVSTKQFFFSIPYNTKYLKVFQEVDKIYNNLLINDRLSSEELNYLSLIGSENLPPKIAGVIEEINTLRNRLCI